MIRIHLQDLGSRRSTFAHTVLEQCCQSPLEGSQPRIPLAQGPIGLGAFWQFWYLLP